MESRPHASGSTTTADRSCRSICFDSTGPRKEPSRKYRRRRPQQVDTGSSSLNTMQVRKLNFLSSIPPSHHLSYDRRLSTEIDTSEYQPSTHDYDCQARKSSPEKHLFDTPLPSRLGHLDGKIAITQDTFRKHSIILAKSSKGSYPRTCGPQRRDQALPDTHTTLMLLSIGRQEPSIHLHGSGRVYHDCSKPLTSDDGTPLHSATATSLLAACLTHMR